MSKLTIPQVIDLVMHLVPTNRPFLMVGKPGVGKTDVANQIAEALGRRLFVSHPAVDDPSDYKGFAFFQNGTADFFPLGQMREIIHCKEPAIWFIDDLGQAPIATQNGIMQYIHHRNRQLGAHRIPDHIAIIAATNSREDNAGVVGMTDPLKGRWVTIVEVIPDIKSWTDWALGHNIDPLVIAYLHYRADNLCQFEPSRDFRMYPTPRGWEHVNELIKLPVTDDLLQALLTGCIGEHVAVEFIQFRNIMDQLPDLDYIERDGESAPLPATNQANYAVVGALSFRGEKSITLREVMKYVQRLPSEYRVLWSEIWHKKNPNMLHSQEWTEWVLQNKLDLTV